MRFSSIVNVVALGLGVAEAVCNNLGTLHTPHLPKFLTNNPLPAGRPWGTKSTPYDTPPNTGVTRSYDFTIARGVASPDGFQKQVLTVNGETPGPTIEANWGDWIEVTLHNNITGPEEGTSLHWHGLLQKETPWFDGLPSVSQCPIAPGGSFTYRFRADRPGTTWYHSHYSAQYAGGLFGPLVIYGPSHVDYDVDLGPIFVSDYFHNDYFSIVEAIVGTNETLWAQPSDNTLINNRGTFNCSLVTDGTPCQSNASLSQSRFTQGKTYRLRLINSGAGGLLKFSIDDHLLTVVSTDFTPIQPYNATYITLGIGQRSDVLVTANGAKNGSYYMRATQSDIPCARANQPYGKAIILYDDAAENSIPPENPQNLGPADPTCSNDPLNLTIPYYPIPANLSPSTTRNILATEPVNSTGNQIYEMDGSSFHADYNNPLLLQATQGNLTFAREWNVYDFGGNTSIRINLWNNNTSPHPMHLHGHDMTILSVGTGQWDGKTIVRPQNPLRRDVQMLPPFGHLVIQFEADNPGVWPFHCHIAWHLSMGYYINILERPDLIRQKQIPMVMPETCDNWNRYSDSHVVLEIDDGV